MQDMEFAKGASYALALNLAPESPAAFLQEFRHVKEALLDWKQKRRNQCDKVMFTVVTAASNHDEIESLLRQVLQDEVDLAPLLQSMDVEVVFLNERGEVVKVYKFGKAASPRSSAKPWWKFWKSTAANGVTTTPQRCGRSRRAGIGDSSRLLAYNTLIVPRVCGSLENSYGYLGEAVHGKFCSAIRSGMEPRKDIHGLFLMRSGDEKLSVDGKPELPSGFEKYLRIDSIEAKITAIGELSVQTREGIDDREEVNQFVTLNVGEAERLLPKMEFMVTKPRGVSAQVIVRTVAEHESEAAVTYWRDKGNKGVPASKPANSQLPVGST